MSSSSTQKQTPATPAARSRTSPPLRRTSTSKASSAAHLTSQRIAADLASFKKSGGRIEVLGNTPLRPYTSRTSSRKAAPAETAAAAPATAAKGKK